MLTEADVYEALKVCYDPELHINIVDLGRVHNIHIEPDTEAPGQRSRVTIHLLTRAEADSEQHDAMLAAQVTNRLLGMRDISAANVTILENPRWTAAHMNAAAKAQRAEQQGLVQLGSLGAPRLQ